MEIDKVKIEYLRKLKANNFTDSESIDVALLNNFTQDEIDKANKWIAENDWFEKIGDDFRLNAQGRQALETIENEIDKKNKSNLEISSRDLNKKWWDRYIDNGYKIIGVPILIWTAILQYNQVGNSADITRLQEKLKADSIQFSATLRDLQNQLARHDSTLEKSKIYFLKYDSLVKSLKVDKQTKKK